jgi:hypothetical protein
VVAIPIAFDGFAEGLAQMKQWDCGEGRAVSPQSP